MAEEKKSLFREKTVQSIQSPESLNEQLRVTSPGVWILMAGMVVFLIGVIIWGIFGRLDATTKVAVCRTSGNNVVCLVPEDALASIIETPEVLIDGQTYALKPDVLEPMVVAEDLNIYIILAGNLNVGQVVYPISVDGNISEDVVSGTVVTESISPMSFLFN